jgi:hypothetical protein
LVPRPLRKRAPGPTASLHKAAPRARRSRDRPRPKSLLKGDRLGLRQAPQPAYSPPGTFRHLKRSTRDPDRPRGLRPATFSGCLSQATTSRRPRIPSCLTHLVKEHTGTRGYARPPCSAGKPRLIVTKPATNKPLFARILGINLRSEIFLTTLRFC